MAKVSEKTDDGEKSRVNVITYPQTSKSSRFKSPKAPENEKKGRKGDGDTDVKTPNSNSNSNRGGPGSNHPQYVPDTNLTLACLVCLCFNFPLGAIAMYLSLTAARAYRDGEVKRGEKKARWSVFLSLFSIVTTVLIVMSAVLWLAIDKQAQKEMRYKPGGS